MESYAVIDLETTGHDVASGDSIIDIGIVIIENDDITTTYSTLLQPDVRIPPFVEQLTGIHNQDVEDAPLFQEKMDEILSLLEGHTIVAHNVPFDVGFFNDQLLVENHEPLVNDVIDTVELARILYPKAPGYKLNELAHYLQINHKDPHRALSDAIVTAQVFLISKQKIEALPYETIRHLLHLEEQLESDMYQILFNALKENQFSIQNHELYVSHRGMSYKKVGRSQKVHQTIPMPYGDLVEHIFSPNGLLAERMNDYEKRIGQTDISHNIFQSFQEEKHALIEAGTGIGKTIAYLIPALYKAITTDQTVVISTYTTQLQAQLIEEHIPLLRDVFPVPFQATVMKGRQHYISIERFAQELEYMDHDNYDITLTKAILLVWLTETDTGDIDEIQLPSSGYIYFKKISAYSEKDYEDQWSYMSYYKNAIKKAKQSDLIITNHAILSIDMKHNDVLPAYDYLIIDEAHHFDRVIAKQFGSVLNYVSVQHLLSQFEYRDVGSWAHRLLKHPERKASSMTKQTWNEQIEKVRYEVDMFFRSLFSFVKHQSTNKRWTDTGRIEYVYGEEDDSFESVKKINEMAHHTGGLLSVILRKTAKMCATIDEENEDNKELLQDVSHTLTELERICNELFFFFSRQTGTTHIKWIEIEARGAKNAVHLYCEKMYVAEDLQRHFFGQKKSIILTSATLSMKDSFHYMLDTYGLDEVEVNTLSVPSPFSYEKQVQMYVPKDFPAVHKKQDGQEFIEATVEAILSLSTVTNGRMLVLFTSYDMLKKAYYLLREWVDSYAFTLIAQGVSSGSRARLMKNFQSTKDAILLGTSSFWEGVDIPGDHLSCLVMTRLPFQSPNTPQYKAMEQQCEAKGKNPFYHYALPHAVLRFKQGFGRLIRKETDRGIIFICDERIMNASYQDYFIDSIPSVPIMHKPMTDIMNHAEKWF